MIKISHEYGNGLVEPSELEMLNEVIEHCAKELGIKDAYIVLDEEVDAGASCSYDSDEEIIELSINFKDSSFDFILLMVCHEMVHAKQFIEGSLVEVSFSENLWNGKNVPTGSSMIDYYATPWEKEAYALEEKLFASYLKGLI